jgi:hypothetical protein
VRDGGGGTKESALETNESGTIGPMGVSAIVDELEAKVAREQGADVTGPLGARDPHKLDAIGSTASAKGLVSEPPD